MQRAQGWVEVRALGMGIVGPKVLAWGAFECHLGSEGPARSPALNEQRHPDGPGCKRGGWVSLALGSGVPNPLHCSTRHLGKGPSRADPWLGLAPRRRETRTDSCVESGWADRGEGAGQGERGPKGFGAGAIECRRGVGGPCLFSHPD